MKVIIVSDNHGKAAICSEIAARYSDEKDILLHCGDSEFAYDCQELIKYTKVAGNCDYDAQFPNETLIETSLGKIFLTHGHYYRVGFSRNILAREANKYQAKIAIYGHTHLPRCELIDGILCINPGSIAQSRDIQFPNCYAVLEKTSELYQVTYYDEHHRVLTTIAL